MERTEPSQHPFTLSFAALTATEEPPPSGPPDLSVVIVTWDARDLILPCLRALAEASKGLDVEVIVVDNASSDGTVRAVREAYPGATVIANGGNGGLPVASNQGLATARGRHVLFLNPETRVGQGTLVACVAELDAHAGVGMVGCVAWSAPAVSPSTRAPAGITGCATSSGKAPT